MADEDSGGYNESNIDVKMQQSVKNINKYLGDNIQLTKNQLVQIKKTITQHEKKYASDRDHWAWKDKDRVKQRAVALEKIEFQGKQVRMNKMLTRAMKEQTQMYNSIKQSLTGGGRGLSQSIMGVADNMYLLTKRTVDLRKAQEALQKAKTGSKEDQKQAQQLVDDMEELVEQASLGSERLKGIGAKLEGLGKILEKHQGKILIGAGLASVLIGIVSKAIDVAPLFKAMMKLMQFAFTMILMPIGTFFGAVIRPIVIGLVKKIAPEFKSWMSTSLKVGGAIGAFLATIGGDFFGHVTKAMENLANLTGVSEIFNNIGETVSNLNPEQQGGIGLGITGAVVAGTAALVGKVMPRIPIIGGASFFGANNAIKTTGAGVPSLSGGGSTYKPPIAPKANSWQNRLSSSLKKGGVAAIAMILIDEVFAGSGGVTNMWKKYLRDIGGQNEDHTRLFAEGTALTGSTYRYQIDNGDGTTSSYSGASITPDYETMQAVMGQLGITDPKWGDNAETRNQVSQHLEDAGWRWGQAVEGQADSAEIISEQLKGITEVEVVEMTASMVGMMNDFHRMESYGQDINSIMKNLADTYQLTDLEVTKKLEQIGNLNPTSSVNSPEARAARRQLAEDAREAEEREDKSNFYKSGGSDADNFFGADNAVNVAEVMKTAIIPIEERKKEIEQDIIDNYDKIYGEGAWARNTGESDDDRTEAEKQADRNAQTTGGAGYDHPSADRVGISQDDMNRQNNPDLTDEQLGIDDPNTTGNTTIPLLDTGAVDWANHPLMNYGGGQISEPIFGIGRSGRTYSFGEHGAETITPNGAGGGGGGITINIARIDKTADFDQLKPMIQRWILEANSRRGMI